MKTRKNEKGLIIPPFQPKTDLNEYLHSPENIEINQILCDWMMNEKERLDYVNYLHCQLQIVMANIDKPSTLLSHLLCLYPEDTEDSKIDMAFLFENLHIKMTYLPEYINPAIKVQIDIIIDMMDDELNRLLEEVDPETYGDGVLRNFRRMLPYTNTGDDPQQEIKRALGVKAGLQQNAVLYGESPEIAKAIKLVDIELRRLSSVYKIPISSLNEATGPKQVNPKESEQQVEEASDFSGLLEALSEFIEGVSAHEFKNIIEHHSMTPGTPKAKWKGSYADAHRFTVLIGMKLPEFDNCFLPPGERKLKHNDKNDHPSRITRIIKSHFRK